MISIIKKILRSVRRDPIMDSDGVFLDIYEKCRNYTMTPKERVYALYNAVKYIIKNKVPGDFVECGVWHGGSVMVIAYTLMWLGVRNRKVWLYDTFEGMPKPGPEDGKRCMRKWIAKPNWCASPEHAVRFHLDKTGYPAGNFIFVRGKVEVTIPGVMPKNIALLRLDTDWYESTKHELNHLYPVLSHAGILLVDDYGHWKGAKQAVDEYFGDKHIFFERIDYAARLAVKVA